MINSNCPGTSSTDAGRSSACAGCPNQSLCKDSTPDPSLSLIHENIHKIPFRIAIMSGKGGVGKSTICRSLSEAISLQKYKVLLLDFDLTGPSIPKLTKSEDNVIFESNGCIYPIKITEYFYCLSIGHFLNIKSSMDSAYKTGLIREILMNTQFDNFEYLFIDTPPGVGDEHLGMVNYLDLTMTILVSTPQYIAFADVVRQITFCKKSKIKVFGVVENMKGFICLECGFENIIFKECGIQDYCKDKGIKYLGMLGLKQKIAKGADCGECVDDGIFTIIGDMLIQETTSN